VAELRHAAERGGPILVPNMIAWPANFEAVTLNDWQQ
jgi:hypothetical protein